MSNLLFLPNIPPTPSSASHDPYFASVVLLAHFDNNFTDSSSFGHSVTQFGSPNALTTSSTQSQFGGFSCFSTNASHGALWNSSADFGLGTGDYTIECSLYFTSIATAQEFIDFRTAANQPRPTLYFNSADNTFRFFSSNADRIISATSIMSTNAWKRFALVRHSAVTTMYFEGTATGSTFADTENCATTSITFMNAFNAAAVGVNNGYMDELRVTKGVARYLSNYTPATAPFPNQ